MYSSDDWNRPIRAISALTSIPTIFMLDALPATVSPNLSWLGIGTKYAGLHTLWLG